MQLRHSLNKLCAFARKKAYSPLIVRMNRFSVTSFSDKIVLYTCARDVFERYLLRDTMYELSRSILALTFLENEVTFYLYQLDTADNVALHLRFSDACISDHRRYIGLNIHEDIPGIDHVGIIHRISGYFLKRDIPILYLNTYGHNLVLVAEEYMSVAKQILEEIAWI